MSTQNAWALLCRLFKQTTPTLRCMLTPREWAAADLLGKAIKPAMVDQDYVFCPSCGLQKGQVFDDGQGGRECRCPECGPVTVRPQDTAAMVLDEAWFLRGLRQTLDINSRDHIIELADGVWRLGNARNAPVMLLRDATLLWREPALLERVRVPSAGIQVIAPKMRQVHGMPFGPDVQWLPLEERFTFYANGISFIAPPELQAAALTSTDPTTPVHGPFSADFKWVTLPAQECEHGPIRCTEGQAAVFKALWSFKGELMPAYRIMDRAGLKSDKLIHVFKVKASDKDKPEAHGPLLAYRALVTTRKREGLYAMACAENSFD
jgi:hypothetical protein